MKYACYLIVFSLALVSLTSCDCKPQERFKVVTCKFIAMPAASIHFRIWDCVMVDQSNGSLYIAKMGDGDRGVLKWEQVRTMDPSEATTTVPLPP